MTRRFDEKKLIELIYNYTVTYEKYLATGVYNTTVEGFDLYNETTEQLKALQDFIDSELEKVEKKLQGENRKLKDEIERLKENIKKEVENGS